MTLLSFDEAWDRLCTGRTAGQPLRPDTVLLRPDFSALRPESPDLRADLDALRAELPSPLRAELSQIGQRTTPEELNGVLIGLCTWRSLSLAELAALTDRSPNHLRSRNIKHLISAGRLAYLHADEPNHPNQKYMASSGDRS